MADPDPPFLLTYIAPAPPLPSWLSYTSSATLTTTAVYSVATLVQGTPTLVEGRITMTVYGTDVIQLPLTVDVPEGEVLAFPYTRTGGFGAVIGSVLGGSVVTLDSAGGVTKGLVPATVVSPAPMATAAPDSIPPALPSVPQIQSPASPTLLPSAIASQPALSDPTTTLSTTYAMPITSSAATLSSAPSSSVLISSSTTLSASSSAAPPLTPSVNQATSRPSLGVILGPVLAVLILIILLLLLFLRRRRKDDDWGSFDATPTKQGKKFWQRGSRGSDGAAGLAAAPLGRNEMRQQYSSTSVFVTPPRARSAKHGDSRVSVDEMDTLLDESIYGDEHDGRRSPYDPLNHPVTGWEERINRATGMLERIAVSDSPFAGSQMGEDGDISTPQSQRYRVFASPVISEMGWLGGGAVGTPRRREQDMHSRSTDSLSSGSGSNGLDGNVRTSLSSTERDSFLPRELTFTPPRWTGARNRAAVRGEPTSEETEYLDRLPTTSDHPITFPASSPDSSPQNLDEVSPKTGRIATGLGGHFIGRPLAATGPADRFDDAAETRPSVAPLRFSKSTSSSFLQLTPSPPRRVHPRPPLPSTVGRETARDGGASADRIRKGLSIGSLGYYLDQAMDTIVPSDSDHSDLHRSQSLQSVGSAISSDDHATIPYPTLASTLGRKSTLGSINEYPRREPTGGGNIEYHRPTFGGYGE